MIPVMLLISCFSIMILKTNGYVGSELPLRLFFFRLSVPLFTAIERKKKQQKKMSRDLQNNFFSPSPSFFRETQRGALLFLSRTAIAIPRGFEALKASTAEVWVFLCCCSSLTALLKQGATRPQPSLLKDVDWLLQPCHLSVSRPTNVYNQNQYQWASRPAQKCAF